MSALAARMRTTRFCLLCVGTEQMHVVWREAGIEKALLHGLGCGGHAALRSVGGVGLDELLEDVAGFSAFGSARW